MIECQLHVTFYQQNQLSSNWFVAFSPIIHFMPFIITISFLQHLHHHIHLIIGPFFKKKFLWTYRHVMSICYSCQVPIKVHGLQITICFNASFTMIFNATCSYISVLGVSLLLWRTFSFGFLNKIKWFQFQFGCHT
jgi:hypothetical protein